MIVCKRIVVGEGEKRHSYVAYPVETRLSDNEVKLAWRRYSDFELLRNHFIFTYPQSIIPYLPNKRIITTVYRRPQEYKADVDVMEKRRLGLERFLKVLSKHPSISTDPAFFHFLSHDTEIWKQYLTDTKEGRVSQMLTAFNHALKLNNTVNNTNNNNNKIIDGSIKDKNNNENSSTTNENIITNNTTNADNIIENSNALNIHTTSRDTVNRDIDHSSAICTQLNNFISISTKMSIGESQTGVLLQELGEVLSGWSVMENDDGYQAAGHYVDAISQDVVCDIDEYEQVISSFISQMWDLHALRDTCKRSLDEKKRMDTCNSSEASGLSAEIEAFHAAREKDMTDLVLKYAMVHANKYRKAANSWKKVTESLEGKEEELF